MLQKTRLILFDLDGTLVDSVPDLAWCADQMMLQLGLPERGVDAVRDWVGNGVERLVKRTLCNAMHDEPDSDLFDRALKIFFDLYSVNSCQRSDLYPGVREGLDALNGGNIHLACVTNKAGTFTRAVLDGLDLQRYFELVVAGDTTAEKKPHPLPLLHAAETFDLLPSECLMVGDSSNDVKAARAAGFGIVCVPYGYNHGEDIRNSQPDQVIESVADLAALLIEAS